MGPGPALLPTGLLPGDLLPLALRRGRGPLRARPAGRRQGAGRRHGRRAAPVPRTAPGRRPADRVPQRVPRDRRDALPNRPGRRVGRQRADRLDRRGRGAGHHHLGRPDGRPAGPRSPADDGGQLPRQRLGAGPPLPGPLPGPGPGRGERDGRAAGQRHAAARRLAHPPVHRRGLRLEPVGLPAGRLLAGRRLRPGRGDDLRHGHSPPRRGDPRRAGPRGAGRAGGQQRLLTARAAGIRVPAAPAGRFLGRLRAGVPPAERRRHGGDGGPRPGCRAAPCRVHHHGTGH